MRSSEVTFLPRTPGTPRIPEGGSMHLAADDLLARIRQNYPTEYELCRLQLLTEVQAAEIERLNASQVTSYTATARPYPLPDEQEMRHG